ncbi:tryptophan-rich sensory protein [Arthrobacter sp. I2-34]|uniref:Tryptophan-rich sensory protein n=1 Tax=Arthrobacter hankyongi TaxID=2904801 RepID=A0ABS9L8L5_9MICC|nr:tryptophan-rich sensory protein [Arthrobacter hankyongi]MCG2622837.1 tryptophan-rich sensory protein [Arthrobacter hankyongi]
MSLRGAADVARQLAVTLSLAACAYTAVRGSSLSGAAPIAEAAGGAFAPGYTLLSPGYGAFLIWAPIYLGLLAYTVYQWWPAQRRSRRQRGMGWLAAAAMLLNAGWIYAAQAGQVGLTLIVILLLLAVLAAAVHVLNRYPDETRADGLLVDAPMGLYLGWILFASAANAAIWLTVQRIGFGDRTIWAVLAVAAAAAAGAATALSGRGRLSVALSLCWGLAWLMVARWAGEPQSPPVAIAAGFGMFFVLVCGLTRRSDVEHQEHLDLRHRRPVAS